MNAIERASKALNSFLEKIMPILTPTGVVIGLVLGSGIAFLKPSITWVFASVTLANSMAVSVSDFVGTIRKPRPIASFMLSSYLLIPLVGFLFSSVFFSSEPDTAAGYILLTAIPTAVASTVWSSIFSGSMALSITLLVIGTCLAPLTCPLIVGIFSHSSTAIDMSSLISQLFMMVVIPSIVGMAINRISKGGAASKVAPSLKPLSKLGIFYVVIINTAQVADRVIEEASAAYIPQVLVAVLLSVSAFALSFLVCKLIGVRGEEAVSAVYASGMKNISAALVIAIGFFPAEAAIPVISGIVTQQTICALMGKVLFRKQIPDRR